MKIEQNNLELVGVQIVEGMVDEHSTVVLANPNDKFADTTIKMINGSIFAETFSVVDGIRLVESVKAGDWVMIDKQGFHYNFSNEMFMEYGYEVVKPKEYEDSVEKCEGYPVTGSVDLASSGGVSGYIGTEHGGVFVMSGFIAYDGKTLFLITKKHKTYQRVYNRAIRDRGELGELATKFAMEVEDEV